MLEAMKLVNAYLPHGLIQICMRSNEFVFFVEVVQGKIFTQSVAGLLFA